MKLIKNVVKKMIVLFVTLLPKSVQKKIRKNYPYCEHLINAEKWKKNHGDATLRLNYKLTQDSIVFDLGGYLGIWTENIYNKYGCNVFTFEPYNKFAAIIRNKFIDNNKINVFEVGLGAKEDKINLYVTEEGSSVFKTKGNSIVISILNASKFLEENSIFEIDLLKINIEGSEYDLMDHLLETNYIKNIENIQIQFHYFYPNAWKRMENIQNKLKLTHECTYQFPFVWENWKKI